MATVVPQHLKPLTGWQRRLTGFQPPAVVPVLLFGLVLALWHPAGYIGGGGDDYHYLLAVRCAAEHGFCVAPDHWWRRWPIVAPTGLVVRLFGEQQETLAVVPLLYAVAALALLTTLTERLFGRREALIAGAVMAATPVFLTATTELNIDIPEFVFCLAALVGISRLLDDGDPRWALLTGLMTGLAIQARPTSLALPPIFVGAMLVARRGDWVLPFVAAALVPSGIEALAYGLAAGDPLKPWRLSLAHTTIPSTELLPGVDLRQSPLFNPAFIGGWRRPMGIHVHWSIDGLLNVIANPQIGLTLLAAAMLALVGHDTLRAPSRQNKALWFLSGLALFWFGTLTYGLAVDPKPRMFLPVLAAAAIGFAVLAVRRLSTSKVLPVAALVLIIAKGCGAAYDRLDLRDQARVAPQWIGRQEPGLAIEARTARFLALVPDARTLPVALPDSTARRVLMLADEADCRRTAASYGFERWRVVREWVARHDGGAAISRLRATGLFLGPAKAISMCLVSRP